MSTKTPIKPLIWIVCPETLALHGYSIHDVPATFSELSEQDQDQIMLLYRNKTAPQKEAFKSLKWLTNELQTPQKDLMTYGQPDWVHQLNLAGLHLPDQTHIKSARTILGSNYLLGISRHADTYTNREGHEGADYIFMSPIFQPLSKTMQQPQITQIKLTELCTSSKLPIISLGGINTDNLSLVRQAGSKGAAFIGSVFQTSNLRQQLENLCTSWRKASG